MMTERLKRIQSMAQRYNRLGVVKDETVSSINAGVEARIIPEIRLMAGDQIKEVRARYEVSQTALVMITGMSIKSV